VAKKRKNLIIWLIAFSILILVATGAGLFMLLDGGPSIGDSKARWLHVRITPMIAEAPGSEGLILDPAEMPPLTTEISKAITTAATDDSIEGLLLEVEGVGMGWGQVQEIRDAILHFREGGKPSVAWAEQYGNKEYFLASAAQEVHLAPEGLTLVNGLSMTSMYYAGTFEKFGVTANFEHVGDFKSAVEPYERRGPSPAAAEATNALLDSIYGQFLRGIAQGRNIEIDAARALVDDPPLTGADALETGLVDSLSYRDEVDELIDGDTIKIGRYIQDSGSAWLANGKRIAVVHAEGTIVSGRGGPGLMGGQRIGSTSLNKLLKEVREDDEIAAVVIRVNSPGGSAMASDAIWREVGRTQDEKPVVISMGDLAASGGYYMSMGADQIIAQPGTITGSIGVLGGKLNLSGLYAEVGLSLHHYERGARADLLSSTKDFDPEDRAKFRTFLEGFYTTFVQKAAQGRGITYEELEAVAQGRVWTGEQALSLGLVDQLGGLDLAVHTAADLAGVTGPVVIERYPERLGFVDQLVKEMSNPESSLPSAHQLQSAAPIQDVLQAVMVLEEVLADDGIAAILPGHFRID